MPKAILTEQGGKGGGGSGITLIKIAVTKPPQKKEYLSGETFQTTGMEVTGYYGSGETVLSEVVVTGYQVTPDPLVDSTHEVTITYTDMGSTCSTTQEVTVKHKLVSIASTTPTVSTYKYDQQLQPAGAIVTAHYTDNATANVTAQAKFEPMTLNRVGQQEITVSYTEEGVTQKTTFNVTVGKADGQLTADNTAINIGAGSGQTVTVTINKHGSDGQLTATELQGVTISGLEGTSISFKGDGQTVIDSGQITITMAEGTNYTKATLVFNIHAEYWSWGDGSEVGDADWWAGLKSSLATADQSTRKNYVGHKKKVKLSKAMKGWDKNAEVSMICIGYDVDADKSLTFQTEGCSPTSGAFSSVDATWATSLAKTEAEDFANNCSASASILQVTKLTSSTQNGQQNNTADVETPCHGFITSDCEMGFKAGANAGSGLGYASSYTEQTKDRTGPAYQYYTSNETRKKYQCQANGSLTTSYQWYWERSRVYDTATSVCRVSYDGTPNRYTYDYTTGRLAPAFVIG